jgi:dienelactone hydrolase
MNGSLSRRDFLGSLLALPVVANASESHPVLPGTQPLRLEGDLPLRMVQGIDRFLMHETEASIRRRMQHWNPDFSSPEAYAKSVASNRDRFHRIIGIVDKRVPFDNLTLEATLARPALVATGVGYKVYSVSWPVLERVDAEGLLLEPEGQQVANVVVLPDADWTPEYLAGIEPGLAPRAQFARRLAENRCRVVVPVLINRQDTWSGDEVIGYTNQTHREVVLRMAYQVGRHIIGYEVQKVMAAVDWFTRGSPKRPVGVIGYGEGGLVAFYSAAADPRINAVVVSGYFGPREDLWKEPIYRHVWALLTEFGDAELAGLIAPRALTVEASRGPELPAPPPITSVHHRAAAPGSLTSPDPESVRREFERAKPAFAKLGASEQLFLVADEGNEPGCDAALTQFLRSLGGPGALEPSGAVPSHTGQNFDVTPRQRRQFRQLIDFTTNLANQSEYKRKQFWSKADTSSPEKWERSLEPYRRYLWEEVTGKLPLPLEPLDVRTRGIYDEPEWVGYEVYIPMWPDVFAYGILLLPKDLKSGERRPVVICQHGITRRVQYIVDPKLENAYHHFAARLAQRGFIVYAPQNPYMGEPQYPFRQFGRKMNPLKLSIFSFVLAQYERTLDWLCGLPCVDSGRIGFYGLSYGGLTAVRAVPLLNRIALAISSANFTDWVRETTDWDREYSALLVHEYDFLDFDQLNAFNHAELANMIAPRPFMVEHGHLDSASPYEWVAYEYAKVCRHYAKLGIPDRTQIEFFQGPHEIHGVGTFEFLHRHLNWPEPRK